jgi:CheY-like chemotaxis protein
MIAANTILVVENEPDLMEMIRELLADTDVKVVGAGDGEEALSFLADNALPSLILLDFHMPNMDGFEFRARQLKDARLRGVPVVFMTAIDSIPSQRDHRDKVVCLKKPFSREELVDVVSKHIS